MNLRGISSDNQPQRGPLNEVRRRKQCGSGNSLRLGLLLPEKGENTLAALLAQRVKRYRVGEAAEDGERMLGLGSSVPHPRGASREDFV